MLQIKTNQLKARKKVLIDDHEYTVRRLGAGEELALSQAYREMKKLEKKAKAEKSTDADDDKALELANKVFNVLAGTFDDGGDGRKSRELVSSLSNDELKEVYDTIFKEEQVVLDETQEKPE
jgi:hypothetical protein